MGGVKWSESSWAARRFHEFVMQITAGFNNSFPIIFCPDLSCSSHSVAAWWLVSNFSFVYRRAQNPQKKPTNLSHSHSRAADVKASGHPGPLPAPLWSPLHSIPHPRPSGEEEDVPAAARLPGQVHEEAPSKLQASLFSSPLSFKWFTGTRVQGTLKSAKVELNSQSLWLLSLFLESVFFCSSSRNYLAWEGTTSHSASALRPGGDAICHLGTRLWCVQTPNADFLKLQTVCKLQSEAGFNTAFIACATSMKNGFQVSPLNIIWRFKAAHNPLYILFYILPVVWTT